MTRSTESQLTYTQRAALRRRGIVVCIEYANGNTKCLTPQGERIYTLSDLKQMAKPGFMDRLTAWIGGAA